MNRHRTLSPLSVSVVFALFLFAAWLCTGGPAPSAAEPQGDGAGQQDAAKSAPADLGTLAGQIKELQKQVAALQARAGAASAPRIIAAGTATWHRPGFPKQSDYDAGQARCRCRREAGDRLHRAADEPVSQRGYPFFVPYWKPANDGFDVILVDTSIDGDGETSNYPNPNTTYPIDWVVVKKVRWHSRSSHM